MHSSHNQSLRGVMRVVRGILREYVLWRRWPRERIWWMLRHRISPLVRRRFRVGCRSYTYFVHPYNRTWLNQRRWRFPLSWKMSEPVRVARSSK